MKLYFILGLVLINSFYCNAAEENLPAAPGCPSNNQLLVDNKVELAQKLEDLRNSPQGLHASERAKLYNKVQDLSLEYQKEFYDYFLAPMDRVLKSFFKKFKNDKYVAERQNEIIDTKNYFISEINYLKKQFEEIGLLYEKGFNFIVSDKPISSSIIMELIAYNATIGHAIGDDIKKETEKFDF